jgi:dihydrofolate reductase
MRKIILGINVTPEGFCNHEAVVADDELHDFYNDLLRNADTMLFGRKTFQLLEGYWPEVAKNKKGSDAEIRFAELATEIRKIVFSKSGFQPAWENTTVYKQLDPDEIRNLKEQPGKNILVGSPSIVDQLISYNLIDEFWFLVQPVISGNGKRFFEKEKLSRQIDLVLSETKILKSGAVALGYKKKN